MALDINRLTLGEVAKIEELSGQSISAIGDEDAPKGKALAAMAFVAKRRENPKFSWNEATALTFDEANELIGLSTDDEDETEDEPEAEPEPGSEDYLATTSKDGDQAQQMAEKAAAEAKSKTSSRSRAAKKS